jgi:hypothetical protein
MIVTSLLTLKVDLGRNVPGLSSIVLGVELELAVATAASSEAPSAT